MIQTNVLLLSTTGYVISKYFGIFKENRIWKNTYAALQWLWRLWRLLVDKGWIAEGAFGPLWRYPAMAERREKQRGWNIGQTEPPPPQQVRLQLRGEWGLRNYQQSGFISFFFMNYTWLFIWRHISRIYDHILKYTYFQTFTDKQHQSWMIFQ